LYADDFQQWLWWQIIDVHIRDNDENDNYDFDERLEADEIHVDFDFAHLKFLRFVEFEDLNRSIDIQGQRNQQLDGD